MKEAASGSSPFTSAIFGFATATTIIAGVVDAIGYANLGQFYLSFMSGNTTRMGMAFAVGDVGVAAMGAAIIATFIFGAFAGSLLVICAGALRLPIVLGAEILCFATAYVLVKVPSGNIALLPIALAMGMQNAMHQTVAGVGVGKSFVTGTVFGIGDALAQAVLGRGHYSLAIMYAASWTAFALGVVFGALSLSHLGLDHALLTATAALLVLSTVSLVLTRNSLIAPRCTLPNA